MANVLGIRRYYLYTDDTGESFKFQTDQDLGEAVGAVEDDTNPDLPRRFEPRGIYVQAEVEGRTVRKLLTIPDSDNPLYAENFSQTVTIDGVEFYSTGRVGEKVSFGANRAIAPVTPPTP